MAGTIGATSSSSIIFSIAIGTSCFPHINTRNARFTTACIFSLCFSFPPHISAPYKHTGISKLFIASTLIAIGMSYFPRKSSIRSSVLRAFSTRLSVICFMSNCSVISRPRYVYVLTHGICSLWSHHSSPSISFTPLPPIFITPHFLAPICISHVSAHSDIISINSLSRFFVRANTQISSANIRHSTRGSKGRGRSLKGGIISFMNKEKRIGLKGHPCLNPRFNGTAGDNDSPTRILILECAYSVSMKWYVLPHTPYSLIFRNIASCGTISYAFWKSTKHIYASKSPPSLFQHPFVGFVVQRFIISSNAATCPTHSWPGRNPACASDRKCSSSNAKLIRLATIAATSFIDTGIKLIPR